MKRRFLPATLFTLCVSATTSVNADSPQIYLNQNLGFNVEGYNYAQSEYPCDLDKVLVEQIVTRANSSNIRMEAAGTVDKILQTEIPVLAIDIEALVLGSKEYTFGTRSKSNLPSVRVTAALIDNNNPDNLAMAQHSCAIATLNELTPSSDVLDMGTYGHTVCSATHKCLNDLSKDIVQWLIPQLP